MPDLLHLTTDQWIALWSAAVTGLLGLAALAGTTSAIFLTVQANGREAKRDARQDRDRVDRWLAEYLVETSNYVATARAWLEVPFGGFTGQSPPLEPDASRLRALLDAAGLVGTLDDREVLLWVRGRLKVKLTQPVEQHLQPLIALAALVEIWRATGDAKQLLDYAQEPEMYDS